MIQNAWLGQLLNPTLLVRRKAEDHHWKFALGAINDSATMVLPASKLGVKVASHDVFEVSPAASMEWIGVVDLCNWEAMTYRVVSPVHQVLKHPSLFLHRNRAVRVFADSDPADLLIIACRAAFWCLGVMYLRQLLDHLGYTSPESDLFSVLFTLIQTTLKTTDDETLNTMQVRLRNMVPSSGSLVDELLEHEEVLGSLSKDEEKEMHEVIKK